MTGQVRGSTPRWRTAAVAVAVGVLVAGCGVPTDPSPHVIAPEEFPRSATTAATVPDVEGAADNVIVYFLRDQKLAPVSKRIAKAPGLKLAVTAG